MVVVCSAKAKIGMSQM